jgi:GAF domain-containing protein
MLNPTAMLTEAARLRALQSYGVLDTDPEPELDELARAAAVACQVPVGLVSLVDRERQFFKARIGIDLVETPRPGSFCDHAIARGELFEVPDATLDPRFTSNALVAGEPHIRFYAGAPLIDASSAALGTLCVLDWQPHRLAREQGEVLRGLARQVVSALQRRKEANALRTLRDALDSELRQTLERLARHVGKLRGAPPDLLAAMEATDSALQQVDDAVEACDLSDGLTLRRQKLDLAALCGELAAALQESGRVLFSAAGPCDGSWDPDRLTHAIAILLDEALAGASGEIVRFSVSGASKDVAVEIRALSPERAGTRLRRGLASGIVRAHGGRMEVRRGRGELSFLLSLPRG